MSLDAAVSAADQARSRYTDWRHHFYLRAISSVPLHYGEHFDLGLSALLLNVSVNPIITIVSVLQHAMQSHQRPSN